MDASLTGLLKTLSKGRQLKYTNLFSSEQVKYNAYVFPWLRVSLPAAISVFTGGQPMDELLSTQQAAELLRVHPVTLAKYRAAGTGPKYLFHPRPRRNIVRYRREDLLNWLRPSREGHSR